MIKYLLKCKDCKQEFESWFSASNEYDRLLNSVYICDIIEGLLGINKLNLIKNKY